MLSLVILFFCSSSFAQNSEKEIEFSKVKATYKNESSTSDKTVLRVVSQIKKLDVSQYKSLFDALSSKESSKFPSVITTIECEPDGDCIECTTWCGIPLGCIQTYIDCGITKK